MPYTYDTGGYELKTTPYHTLENAEATTRQSIQDSLQNAMDIKSGRATPGGFMKKRTQIQPAAPSNYDFNSDLDDLDDYLNKESALSYMIKKYAFKN
jgi:predicted enzyme related to lactoylglutathione lyase